MSPNLKPISVITPVLNEAKNLSILAEQKRLLQRVFSNLEAEQGSSSSSNLAEWILVDGGSNDQTVETAKDLGFSVIETTAGRAHQQNAGAKHANGELLLFLHADTQLSEAAIWQLLSYWQADPVQHRFWGRFDVKLSGSKLMFRLIERMINLRSRCTGISTGDQGQFFSRVFFLELGGFPQQPLMEDIEISKRAKRLARPCYLSQKITTSSRRWEQFGTWRTIRLMWRLRWQYWLGASAHELSQQYRNDQR
ncbi:MAG: TIGR04283 family arsenosugar biosynthesis glycosyltransferase [Pseudomonadota bacterium]|nr:TIGR04283 family arsenosugar biosynthesis glycosyltransferase [Pseudomonadota bacterium]